MSFGHADRQVAHRLRGDRRVARAADARPRRRARPSACSAREHRRRAAPHGVDAGAAVGGADELGVVGAAGARDLLAADVGRDLRLAQHAGVDQQDVDARLAQAVAQEAVLDALRVQRADEDDGAPSAALHAEVAALQLGVGRPARPPSSRRRSARPPSRAGARPSPSPWPGSARRTRIARPSAARPRKVSIRVSMIVGASPSEGSSMISSLGLRQQRAADGEHLLLAAGELHAAVLAALGQAREELVDGVGRPAVAAAPRRGHPQVLVDGERLEQPPPLGHVADPGAGDLVRRARRRARGPRRRSSRSRAPGGICMIALHSVVLPMPLRPMSATGSSPISKLTSCRTCARP